MLVNYIRMPGKYEASYITKFPQTMVLQGPMTRAIPLEIPDPAPSTKANAMIDNTMELIICEGGLR